MTLLKIFATTFLFLTVFAGFASAQNIISVQGPIVPCGVGDGPPCNICHVPVLFKNLIDYFTYYVAIPFSALSFIFAAFLSMVSVSENRLALIKRIMSKVGWGLVAVFFSWLIIDILVVGFVGEHGFKGAVTSFWYQIPGPEDCPLEVKPACSDGEDNDYDGLRDYPADPGCDSTSDDNETDPFIAQPQCYDKEDNDGDGKTDYPDDPECSSIYDNDEAGGADCSNPKLLAQSNNTAYPAQNAPELNSLISCIGSSLSGLNLGDVATIDSIELCNYTRGAKTCTISCNHTLNSCHYGGATGSEGALAVDFGNEIDGNQIINAAMACGAKSARCENSSGATVPCGGPPATHVHVNAASCDRN